MVSCKFSLKPIHWVIPLFEVTKSRQKNKMVTLIGHENIWKLWVFSCAGSQNFWPRAIVTWWFGVWHFAVRNMRFPSVSSIIIYFEPSEVALDPGSLLSKLADRSLLRLTWDPNPKSKWAMVRGSSTEKWMKPLLVRTSTVRTFSICRSQLSCSDMSWLFLIEMWKASSEAHIILQKFRGMIILYNTVSTRFQNVSKAC